MLEIKLPLPVKFICSFIYRDETTFTNTCLRLKKKFGPIDYESPVSRFDFTTYYDKEMGSPLYRRFVSFLKLVGPAKFVDIKLFCVNIEKKYAHDNKRSINIDPGYLNEAKFVLTTTKDFYHRLYIGKGIYAELTLFYRDGAFQDLPTTYPDYRSREYKNILNQIRERYRMQIKHS